MDLKKSEIHFPSKKTMSYFKNIFTTGAFSKTPFRVLKRIIDEVGVPDPALVIELGAGKGEITENILTKLQKPFPPYLAFEINKNFASELRKNFKDITVLELDALNFAKFAPEGADLIICSLPISFFTKKNIDSLLEKIKQKTLPGGKAIILFHAFWLIPKLQKILTKSRLIRIPHIPPYYIIVYNPL